MYLIDIYTIISFQTFASSIPQTSIQILPINNLEIVIGKKTTKTLTTAEIREQKTKEVLAKLPKIKKSELTISPEVMAVVANVPQMDADVDYDKIKYDYLMEKYG